MKKRAICLLFLWFVVQLVAAETSTLNVDSLQTKLDWYNRNHPVNNLYVHVDRNEYTPGDTIRRLCRRGSGGGSEDPETGLRELPNKC